VFASRIIIPRSPPPPPRPPALAPKLGGGWGLVDFFRVAGTVSPDTCRYSRRYSMPYVKWSVEDKAHRHPTVPVNTAEPLQSSLQCIHTRTTTHRQRYAHLKQYKKAMCTVLAIICRGFSHSHAHTRVTAQLCIHKHRLGLSVHTNTRPRW
jgi:hypothetical protein